MLVVPHLESLPNWILIIFRIWMSTAVVYNTTHADNLECLGVPKCMDASWYVIHALGGWKYQYGFFPKKTITSKRRTAMATRQCALVPGMELSMHRALPSWKNTNTNIDDIDATIKVNILQCPKIFWKTKTISIKEKMHIWC